MGLGMRGLRMVAAFWPRIPVEVTQEAGVVPRCRRAVIGTPILSPHRTRRETMGVFYPRPQVVSNWIRSNWILVIRSARLM